MQLLRKISTSKQLFVQRLEDEEQEEEEVEEGEQEEQCRKEGQLHTSCNCNPVAMNDKQYACHNNQPQRSVQYQCEAASEALVEQPQLESTQSNLDIQFDLMHYKENVRYLRHTPSNSSLDLQRDRELEQRGYSFSLGSQFDGQYHNLIIREQPPHDDYPIVKWDINGNSLEQEEQDEEQHFDLRQHWANFDSRWRQLQALPSGKRPSSSSHSQRSSHHSSACTLETWIDDADEAQNLLQSSQKTKKKQQQQNNNNNNYNQCLKSF